MSITYKDNWMAQATMADSLAHIYEIQGKYPLAVEYWNKVIDILKNDLKITEGETIEAPLREIQRLKRY